MKDLNKYYDSLFKLAVKFETRHKYAEYSIIILLIASNFFAGYILYCITIVSFVVQIFSFWIKKKQSNVEAIAHRLQEYAMLYATFRNDTFNFDVAQIKGSIPKSIHEAVMKQEQEPESSDYAVDESTKNALLLMIQENAFWNRHLYNAAMWSAIVRISILVALIVIFVFLSWGTPWILSLGIPSNDQQYNVPRLLIAFLSANILFNQIDNIVKWYKAAKDMFDLDNSIERQVEKGEDFWLHTFTFYNVVKSATPLIASSIYEKHQSVLNEAWKSRIKKNSQNKNR